jgi:hypothetical protein
VTPEEKRERAFVIDRDGECVLVKRDPAHQCHRMGFPHRATVTRLLTVEHVKDAPMMGRRAASDRQHMVAMCFDANVAVPSREVRAWIREYLAKVNA